MNKTLLARITFLLLTVSTPLVLQVSAQQTTETVRRNSPFSPNPKRKDVSAQTASNSGKPAEKQTGNVVSVDSLNKIPVETASNTQYKNVNFESRSAANKTLEVAKRAAAATASPTEVYRVGIGDVLFISLQNAPAKDSTYFTVLKDGTIDYPLANEMVSVSGLTTDEIESNLKTKIKLFENPIVSVNVREHNSHSYKVLGAVEKPGEKFIQSEAVPLFVVRAESSVQSNVTGVVVNRANGTTENIDAKDSHYDEVLIFSGDIVEFKPSVKKENEQSSAKPQFYYIGGAIKSSGQKDYVNGLTLNQAIFACGGLKKSKSQTVIIRRKNTEGLLISTEYDLKAIKDGKIPEPELQAGDMIEINN